MSRATQFIAMVAASIAAATGAVVVTRAQHHTDPRYLLELPGEAITVEPIASTGPTEPPDAPADAIAAARDQGRAEGRRAALRTVAGAVSLMSMGALIAILVMFATGALDRPPTVGLAATTVAPTPPAIAPPAAPAVVPPTASPADQDAAPAISTSDQRPDPAVIDIPAIGIRASVISLGLIDGALEVPTDFSQAGWWTDGPEPGEIGPAVIVGHVDSQTGPAIFFNLDQLNFGDEIIVTRRDGSSATFAVRSTITVDKDEFPTEQVYGPTDDAELRLITCDGDFADGSYLGNLIVMADLVRESPPATTGVLY